ncbi:MAG: uroporphyrinogen decarboxylase [Burkholderiales bacterium]|nr:uroporphyrinogen decarboxylase [Burkholderiales bacterium]
MAQSPFLKACRGQKVPYTPVWLMRQAGRYQEWYRGLRSQHYFLDLCKNPQLAAEVTVRAVQDIRPDAAILFSDILLIVETMGLELTFNQGEGPAIASPVRDVMGLCTLREIDPDELGFVYEAIHLARHELPANIPLIGFAGAPFTVASYLIEGGTSRNFERTKAFMFRHPQAWHELMGLIARGTAGYLRGQVQAGVQAVQLFDSWAGVLGVEDYREFVLPHSQRVLQAISEVPRIHFGRGTCGLLEAFDEAGADVVGVDFLTSLAEARQRLGSRPVQGNLDPSVLLADRDYIRQRVARILEANAGNLGHIFNLGHGVLPGTPAENVRFLIEIVHEMTAG